MLLPQPSIATKEKPLPEVCPEQHLGTVAWDSRAHALSLKNVATYLLQALTAVKIPLRTASN